MSVKAMQTVWEHSGSTGCDRLVLLAIADCANDEGVAWPSLTTIAKKANINRRTVSRSVAALESAGELRRASRGGSSTHGGVSNAYRLTISQGQHTPTSSPTEDPAQAAIQPRTRGQHAPRDKLPLAATSPNVGASRPEVGATRPPNRKNPKNHQQSVARAPKRKPASTPAPEEFEITAALRAYATKKNIEVNLETETEKFLNHHRAKGSRFSDWHSAWRNWVMRAQEYAERDGRVHPPAERSEMTIMVQPA